MKQKLDKWDRWLDVIYNDMVHQAASRAVFRETMEIVRANPAIPKASDLFEFLEQWCVDSIVMGLRRQIKVDPDSVSLTGLLYDIALNSGLLSRVRFVALYPSEKRRFADAAFDKHVGVGASHVNAAAVRADIEKVRRLAQRCEDYADRLVAHRDKRGVSAVPTYKELNKAIDFAESLLKRYYFLLRADSLVSVEPRFPLPWKRVFTVAWAPPKPV
jgi:hypothetical protein